MIQHAGVWLPDGERHMVEWMTKNNQVIDGKQTYQWSKQTRSYKYCTSFRTAIDIGAHVGLWSMHLVHWFHSVHAFEPVAAHRECFERNLEKDRNVLLYPYALGESNGQVSIHRNYMSSGDSYVDGEGSIPMRRLDDFDIQSVDFIKVDCEGYELYVLRGGEKTIKRWRPTICVEQKPRMAAKYGLGEIDAVKYLQGLGATLREQYSGDYFLTFE